MLQFSYTFRIVCPGLKIWSIICFFLFCRWWSDITMYVQRHTAVCASIMPWSLAICQGEGLLFVLFYEGGIISYFSYLYVTLLILTGRTCLFTLHNLQSSVSSSSCWVRRKFMAQNKIQIICRQRCLPCIFGRTNSCVFDLSFCVTLPASEWLKYFIEQVIGMMGGLAYLADKDGSFRDSFNDSWDRILSRHPIPFYYCIGKFTLCHTTKDKKKVCIDNLIILPWFTDHHLPLNIMVQFLNDGLEKVFVEFIVYC